MIGRHYRAVVADWEAREPGGDFPARRSLSTHLEALAATLARRGDVNFVGTTLSTNNHARNGDITLKAVEMAGTTGYSEQSLLEKWARDSKILDIFEGTQQIQQLIVARRVLGLTSAQLK